MRIAEAGYPAIRGFGYKPGIGPGDIGYTGLHLSYSEGIDLKGDVGVNDEWIIDAAYLRGVVRVDRSDCEHIGVKSEGEMQLYADAAFVDVGGVAVCEPPDVVYTQDSEDIVYAYAYFHIGHLLHRCGERVEGETEEVVM